MSLPGRCSAAHRANILTTPIQPRLRSTCGNGQVRCVFPTAWPESVEPGTLHTTPGQSRAITAPEPSASRACAEPPHTLLDALLCLLAPDSCRICDQRLLRATGYPVCDSCLSDIAPLQPGACCHLCSEPLAPDAFLFGDDHVQPRCATCSETKPRFVRATSYALYDDLREAIHLLKFEGVVSLAKPLGHMLAAAILQQLPAAPTALTVVPVPLFRGKRRFNQSTLLAEAALQHLRGTAPSSTLRLRPGLLRRTRHTESQFLLSPTERRTNVRGAFQVQGSVAGLHILLVDDIYTTGTTARECTRTLLAAGAASVRVATLARAGRDTAVAWHPSALHLGEALPRADPAFHSLRDTTTWHPSST